MSDWRDKVKAVFPKEATYLYRFLRDRDDARALLAFFVRSHAAISIREKLQLVHKVYTVTHNVEVAHTEEEMITLVDSILKMPASIPGVVVEAGCFKGASTAKFSVAAAHAGRKLVVFDSFQGIPENTEDHGENIYGDAVNFPRGSYCGQIDEVKANIGQYGRLEVCDFREGWFDDTMALFDEPVVTAYIDVDLASSTRNCLRYLYPRLVEGGELYSQDGHLPLVIEVLRDETFWRQEVGCAPPKVHGLGESKLVKIVKTTDG